jgi:hypothetical protein
MCPYVCVCTCVCVCACVCVLHTFMSLYKGCLSSTQKERGGKEGIHTQCVLHTFMSLSHLDMSGKGCFFLYHCNCNDLKAQRFGIVPDLSISLCISLSTIVTLSSWCVCVCMCVCVCVCVCVQAWADMEQQRLIRSCVRGEGQVRR